MYQDAAIIIKAIAGNEYLYFDTPVVIKITPHTHPYPVWGVCVSPDGIIYVMDATQYWHKLENKSSNDLLIQSIYQRVSILSKKLNLKSA